LNYVEKFDSGLSSSQGSFYRADETLFLDVHPRNHALGHGGPDTIVVPDAHLLFSGDYRRSGLDLVLSKDGHEFTVRDYFRGESRAALASPDGANLSGKTVGALAGQVDYAQAGGQIAPEKVIGQVTKLTGNATAVRNGVSISLNVGDNVHKGDVVQSGSDSSLGITFIDGTVFGLASNARMVLNEMIYNPAGSGNSSLLTLVQGTISFVAGATAKNGDMKVETPTATMGIRGTAVLVEIDFDISQPGVAPPVSFRILVEPNGTSGEYVLLDKVTLQPIATVNQPGTQTIVNGQGVVTFIASAQIPANAQQLINEIFALKFTDANPKYIGIPPLDSITPNTFVVKLTDGTPINQLPILLTFIALETLPGPPPSGGNTRFHLNIPPELIASSNQFTERFLTTGATALDTVSGRIRFDDINPEDLPTVTARFNSFVYRDAQQTIVTSSLTLEQLAAISAVAVPLSVIPDPGNTNIGEATWVYSVPDQALDFLADGEKLTLIYMARVDTNYSEYNTVVFRPFTITITGTNDLPTVSATGSGIIELDGTNNPEIDHAEGVITFADVDLTDRPTVTAPFAGYVYTAPNGSTLTLTPAQQAAIAAVLTLTPAADNTNNGSVAWSYDVADANFDFIAAGETLVLTYNATVDDGHGGIVIVPLTLTVTVNGTNDIPTITANSGGFTELLGTTDDPTARQVGGTIDFTDVDLTDKPTVTTAHASFTYKNALNVDITSTLTAPHLAAIAAVHPALSLMPQGTNANNGSVTWSYELPDNSFDFLAKGETLALTYTATVNDGHGGIVSAPFTVTITGSNDVPVANGDANTGDAVVESGVNPANTSFADDPTAVGNVLTNDTDVDINHALSVAAVAGIAGNVGLAVTGTYGSVTIGADGSYSYTLDNSDPDTQALAQGEIVTDVFGYRVTDEFGATSTASLTITITGTNDAPVANADTNAGDAVVEAGVNPLNTPFAGDPTAVGSVLTNDTDVDTGHALSVAAVAGIAGNVGLAVTGTYGSVAIGADGSYTYTLDNSDPDTQALAQGGAPGTDVFSYTVTDEFGATSTESLTITITGTNDAPTIISETDAPTQALIVLNAAVPHVLSQGVNTNSFGLDTETFDSRSTGSFRSDALHATFSASGPAGVVSGSSSGVTAAPFVGPLPGHADQTRYLSIGAGGTETITFDDPQNAFGLYWGSVDSYNTIAFYNGNTPVAFYTGADINPLFPTGNQGSFASNGYVEFSGLGAFNRVVLGTGNSNAFEIDNISAGSVHVELSAPISGTMTVSDPDIGDTLTASVIGNAIIDYNGSTMLPGNVNAAALIAASAVTFNSVQSAGAEVIRWTYDPTNPDLDFLHVGDTLTLTFTAQVSDSHGSVVHQPLTITLAGAAASADTSAYQVVNGTSADDTFHNVGGNVTIFGGGGHDTFIFNAGFGKATIADFDISHETINIDHTLFADVPAILASAHATNAGADTVITDAANDMIILRGVTLAQVQAHAAAFHLV